MNLYAMQPTADGPGSYCLHENDEEAMECAAIKGATDVIESHKRLDEWVYVIDGDTDVFLVSTVTKVGTARRSTARRSWVSRPPTSSPSSRGGTTSTS